MDGFTGEMGDCGGSNDSRSGIGGLRKREGVVHGCRSRC